MAFRLLSIATLLGGIGLTLLFYIAMPMAWDARCSMEPCPALSVARRMAEASLPVAGSALLVLVAWHIGKRRQTLALTTLAVPLILVVLWLALLFGPLAG
jgi:hypothetical protein